MTFFYDKKFESSNYELNYLLKWFDNSRIFDLKC